MFALDTTKKVEIKRNVAIIVVNKKMKNRRGDEKK